MNRKLQITSVREGGRGAGVHGGLDKVGAGRGNHQPSTAYLRESGRGAGVHGGMDEVGAIRGDTASVTAAGPGRGRYGEHVHIGRRDRVVGRRGSDLSAGRGAGKWRRRLSARARWTKCRCEVSQVCVWGGGMRKGRGTRKQPEGHWQTRKRPEGRPTFRRESDRHIQHPFGGIASRTDTLFPSSLAVPSFTWKATLTGPWHPSS